MTTTGVYLLHFSSPFRHARHYIGWAKDVERRVNEHKNGYGSKLTQAVVVRGLGISLTKVWEGETRGFERSLKNRKNAAQLCPVCRGEFNERAAANMRKYRGKS